MTSQPKFRRWPWGALAMAIPLIAGVATMAAFNNGAEMDQPGELFRAAKLFFIVLCAGNGYLMTVAIGDLGRSVLAVPVGALAGLASIYAADSSAALKFVIIYFAIITLVAVLQMGRALIEDAGAMLLSTMVILYVVSESRSNSELKLIVAYPIACSMIAASMPLRGGFEGIFSALVVGARASLLGTLAGLIVLPLVFPLLNSIHFPVYASGVVLSVMAANYLCFKLLFDACFRAQDTEKLEIPHVITSHDSIPSTTESEERTPLRASSTK